MKRFFGLASFALALFFVLEASGEMKIVNTNLGDELWLKGDYFESDLERCAVETSEGEFIELYPNDESPGWDVSCYSYCELSIDEATLSYAGIWNLTTYTSNKTFQNTFAVTVRQNVPLKPTTDIYVNAGQWAAVWLDGNDTDVTECKLISSDKKYDLMKDNIEGLSRYRTCGVRMQADRKNAMRWELSRRLGSYLVETGSFEINVLAESEYNKRVINRVWNLGDRATLGFEEYDVVFCQFTKPDGSLTGLLTKCSIEIKVVTEFHRGIWRASYATRGKIELNTVEIDVQTWDSDSLNGIQLPGSGPEINLLCKSGAGSLRFCSFIRPDKRVIHVPVGVGNDNYSYYGDGYQNNSKEPRYADCGLTIHKPSAVDFGLWSCEVGISEDKERVITRAAVIDVVKARAGRNYKIVHPDVIVKRGDQFRVRCTVNALLDYCWLTSPNGTVYSVLPEAASDSPVKYDGKGFTMGDCGGILNRANVSDAGEWTCHLGISGGAEVEGKISVQVADSYLIPVEKKVYANEKPKLSCKTFLGDEGTLQYCRWVRPNGHGINQEDAWRFQNVKEKDRCDLTILAITPEDIGQWTCVAMLTGAKTTEQWATVQLYPTHKELRGTSLVSIILSSGLLIMTLVGSFFAAMYVYRRRKIQGKIKSPPPYDPEDYESPRVIQTGSDQPTADKDYKY